MKTAVITLSVLCVLASFFLGRVSKTCTLCPENIPVIKYIERKETIKKIEDEIHKIIIPVNRSERDSLRSVLNPR